MKIEEQSVELDFDDVLILPKSSKVTSRKNVILQREYSFPNSDRKWTGVGIIAANMMTGTFEMAEALNVYSMLTALHKHYAADELIKFFSTQSFYNKKYPKDYAFYSLGISDLDLAKWNLIKANLPENQRPVFINIDVANGYMESFVEFVRQFKLDNPETIIMAGNVVTWDQCQVLMDAGASMVKCGIGGGCFTGDSLVQTVNGLVPIEKIKIGDEVLTHVQEWKKVIGTIIYDDKKILFNINGIKATPNHEFYVLHEKYKSLVNEYNIHEYAEWISVEDLTKEYFLIKHKK